MKKLLAAMFVALLLVGCGEDIEIPKMLDCDGCKEDVSSKADDCPNCGHPVADSVNAYKEAEEERKANPQRYGGLEALAKIKEANESGATKLDLDSNNISDVSPLKGLTKLKALLLNRNEISDVSPLAGLTNLEWLDLGKNEITDVSPLMGLKLSLLELYDNPISEDQIEMLKKALPYCDIRF